MLPMKTHETTSDFIAQECIGVQMRLLNRVVTRIYDDALRPLGIKTSQLNILVVTARLGLVRPGQIRDRLKMDNSTVSRNVARMRARGWIEVVEDEKDARAHQLRLSAKGQRLLEEAGPAWEEAQDEVNELLGRDGVKAIMSGADHVRAKD